MLIGEVSRRSGVSSRMLRHYDSLGLVRPTGRTTGGYREYSAQDLRRIFHVESLRSLGLSLAEVQQALDDPHFTPSTLVTELMEATRERLARAEELLRRLEQVRDAGPADWEEVLLLVLLLRGLDSAQPAERHRAALGVTQGAPLPAQALAQAYLAESETNVAGALGWALARAGEDGLEELAAGLRASRPEVRRRAVTAVAEVGSDAATALLRGLLEDPDDVVRDRAAVALGARGEWEAVPALVAMVVSGRHDVEAAETLSGLAGTARDADGVAAALGAHADDGRAPVRRRLAQALAEIPGPAAERVLARLARDDDRSVALTARAVLARR